MRDASHPITMYVASCYELWRVEDDDHTSDVAAYWAKLSHLGNKIRVHGSDLGLDDKTGVQDHHQES